MLLKLSRRVSTAFSCLFGPKTIRTKLPPYVSNIEQSPEEAEEHTYFEYLP